MLAIGLLRFIPTIPGTPPELRRSFRVEYSAGISYVVHHPRIRFLMLLFVAVVMFSFGFMTVLPGLLENELGHDAKDLGVLLTVEAAAGLLLNLILASQVSGSRARAIMLFLAAVLGGSFFLLAAAPTFGVAIVAMLFFGPAISGFMLTNNALIMGATDPAYYGRVMSLTMLAFAAQAILAFPIGVIADAIGERETLFLEGVVVLAVATIATLVYLSSIRGLPPTARAAPRPAADAAPTPPAADAAPTPTAVDALATPTAAVAATTQQGGSVR